MLCVLGLSRRSLRRRQGLDDLDARGIDGIVERSYHRDRLVRGGQGLGRGRRLDEQKAVLPGKEEMLCAFFHDMAASHNLNDRENGVGRLGRIPEHFGLKMGVGFELDKHNVRAHINDDVGNAILAFESRLDLGSAGPSERTGGTRRHLFHLSTGRNAGNDQQQDRQKQPRVGSHGTPLSPGTKCKTLRQL